MKITIWPCKELHATLALIIKVILKSVSYSNLTDEAFIKNILWDFQRFMQFSWDSETRQFKDTGVHAWESDENVLFWLVEIGKLQVLEKLNVSFNHLKILTPAVSQLKSLTSLELANNQLTFLPKGRLVFFSQKNIVV